MERYPPKFVEGGAFTESIYRGENYNRHIKFQYFIEIGMVARFPRYVNKRDLDPVVKIYLDENNIEKPKLWDLPIPNEEAAYISLAKYAKEILFMEEQQVKDMNKAWAWTQKQFGPYMKDSKIRSLEEVLENLDMTTSSGFPFNTLYKTKDELFEKEGDLMREWLANDWEEMITDENYSYIATNSLKEELRLQEKIDINSIRTFTAMPTDATVQGNRLFEDMNEKMNAAYLVTASAVGMSPFSGNWERMYRKLRKFSKGYALDESQYDSSLRAYMMWACAEFRYNMLAQEYRTPENKRRIQVYYRNLVNTIIISPNGILLMKKTGNPSGSCNTVNDNTLILFTLLAYAWIRTSPEELNDYVSFEQNTMKMLLGDDNTWTVSDLAHVFYNGRTVIAEWNKIGVTTTTDSLEPRLPEQLDFLSAHTVFMQGKAIPVYSREKLLVSLLYSAKFKRDPALTLERAAAMLLNGWSDPPFRAFCRQFIDWLICKFDHVLYDYDPWIQAKCCVLTDQRYFKIFVGTESMQNLPVILLNPQSKYLESKERLESQIKGVMHTPMDIDRPPRQASSKKKRGKKSKKKQNQNPFSRNQQQQIQQGKRRKGRRGPRTGGGMNLNEKSRGMTFVSRGMPMEGDELIATVNGSSAFSLTSYALNPGNATTFPFASRTAANYDRYEIDFLEVYYKPSQSMFSTQGAAGMVGISVVADAKQSPPSTKVMAEVCQVKTLGLVSKSHLVKVPKKFMMSATNQKHLVRSGQLPGGADITLYDCGQIFFWTQGEANSNEIGELRIRYKFRLLNPVLETSTTAPTNYRVAWLTSNGAESCTTAVSKTLALATTAANGIGLTNTSGSIILPIGNYTITGFMIVQDTAAETFSTDVTLRKNNLGLFTTTGGTLSQNPQTEIAIATGANCKYTIPFNCFYSSNGSDVLTLTCTLTGAAGTLTAEASIVITAV